MITIIIISVACLEIDTSLIIPLLMDIFSSVSEALQPLKEMHLKKAFWTASAKRTGEGYSSIMEIDYGSIINSAYDSNTDTLT